MQNRIPVEHDRPSGSAEVIRLEEHRVPRYTSLVPICSIAEGAHALAALRRAELRIAQLEQSLSQALKDSAVNWARARRAERRLAEATVAETVD